MTEVVFGRGSRARLASAFGPSARVLVIATPGRLPELDDTLETHPPQWSPVARISDVPQHVPRQTLELAVDLAVAHEVDGVLAFGGGSPIGVAKALAMQLDVRKVYVPTTFSGSEMTNIWAVSDEGSKTTGRDDRVRADLVIYDADLVDSMPRALVFVSLFNAMAHAVEALYAPNTTEEVLDNAESAVAELHSSIETLIAGTSAEGREVALSGAFRAGRALDQAQMGIHHKMAHVLGGSFGLGHSEVHTVLLPYSIQYNRDAAPAAMALLSRALGGEPEVVVADLERRAGVRMSLGELGMPESGLDQATDELFERPYPNPRELDRAALRELLQSAWRGELASET